MWFAMLGAEMAYQGAELSDAAWRTHCEALIWSRQRTLDGSIPKRDLPRFAYSANAGEAVVELIEREWWEDRGEYWVLIFGMEWQVTKKQLEARRAADRKRQNRRRAHADGDHTLCVDPDHCHAVTNAVTRTVTNAVTPEQRSEEKHMDEGLPTHPRSDDGYHCASTPRHRRDGSEILSSVPAAYSKAANPATPHGPVASASAGSRPRG